jgi:hypothetical protein
MYYLRCGFADRPPGKIWSSHVYPWITEKTLERRCSLQCGPPGRWSARFAGIRRARQRSRPGKGGERVPTPQGFDSGARPGLGGGRRVGAPAAGGGGRCGSCCGAGVARPRKGATLAGVMGPEENTRAIGLQRRWLEVVVPLPWRQWRRRASWPAAGEGAVHATTLGGLIYPSASLLRGEVRGTHRGTAHRGRGPWTVRQSDAALVRSVRRGARPGA